MARGRKPIPRELKLVRGTLQPCRDNPDAPRPVSTGPVAPAWLDEKAGAHFAVLVGRLESEGRASASHTETIAMAAQRLAEIEALTAELDGGSLTYESQGREGTSMRRMNPAVAARSEAMRHLQSLLSELGLTPASVSKASAPRGAQRSSNPFDAIG